MFTKTELEILQSALRSWKGPYGDITQRVHPLKAIEVKRSMDCLSVAGALAERFEEILQHYFEMENSHLE